MKLLPDIEILGHTISLQNPFVVDNYLVTDIEYFGRYDRWNIIFKCGNYKIEFDMNELAGKARMALSNYLNNSFSIVTYNDDRGFYSYVYQTFCNLDSLYNWFHRKLNTDTHEIISRLVEQGRLYDRCDAKYVPEYDVCKLIGYKKVDTNGNVEGRLNVSDVDRLLESARVYSRFNDFATVCSSSMLRNTMTNNYNSKTYIHQYNYTPEYIKHFMDHENKRTTLLLGAEIEVGGNKPEIDLNNKQSVVKKCIQIMNGSNSDKEDLIYSTHDGTVQIEIDTMPCSLEYHRNKMNYKEMFKYLDEQDIKDMIVILQDYIFMPIEIILVKPKCSKIWLFLRYYI